MWKFLKSLFAFEKVMRLATSEDATLVFYELFRAHGLSCEIKNGWIVANAGLFFAQARVFVHSETSAFSNIQLDLDVRTPDGVAILESCGGLGETRHSAIADAINNMSNGSFHVIFSALTQKTCSHCEVEHWTVNGTQRTVYVGPMVTRSNQPADFAFPIGWFAEMKKAIETHSLDQNMHWIRLYHMEFENGAPVNECLVDNQTDPILQSTLGDCDWTATNGFYSVRIFLIIAKAN